MKNENQDKQEYCNQLLDDAFVNMLQGIEKLSKNSVNAAELQTLIRTTIEFRSNIHVLRSVKK